MITAALTWLKRQLCLHRSRDRRKFVEYLGNEPCRVRVTCNACGRVKFEEPSSWQRLIDMAERWKREDEHFINPRRR